MKKFLIPLFCLLVLAACVKESTNETLLDSATNLELQEQTIDVNKTSNAPNKVDVCHNGNIINININAVPAHQNHGDAVDMDGDGFFDMANSCSEGVDCDDFDPDVNPDADEDCDDEIDNNCDGQINEGCLPDCTDQCCFCDYLETFDPATSCIQHDAIDEFFDVYYIFSNGQNNDQSTGVAIAVFAGEGAICATDQGDQLISFEQAAICIDFILEYADATGIPDCELGEDLLENPPFGIDLFKDKISVE